MFEAGRKGLAILACVMVLSVAIAQTVEGESQLTMDENDIDFYDNEGNEINEATLGDVITVRVNLHNIGDTASNHTEIMLMVYCAGNTKTLVDEQGDKYGGPVVLKTVYGVIPPNGEKEIVVYWDTGTNIGSSIYHPGAGRYLIEVIYYPLDVDEPETDYNSGFAFGSEITIKQVSSEGGDLLVPISVTVSAVLFGVVLVIYAIRHAKSKKR